MARSRQEIDDELAAAQAGYPALAPLNTPSATGIFRLWRFVLATCAQTLETLWDRHTAEVDAIVARFAYLDGKVTLNSPTDDPNYSPAGYVGNGTEMCGAMAPGSDVLYYFVPAESGRGGISRWRVTGRTGVALGTYPAMD